MSKENVNLPLTEEPTASITPAIASPDRYYTVITHRAETSFGKINTGEKGKIEPDPYQSEQPSYEPNSSPFTADPTSTLFTSNCDGVIYYSSSSKELTGTAHKLFWYLLKTRSEQIAIVSTDKSPCTNTTIVTTYEEILKAYGYTDKEITKEKKKELKATVKKDLETLSQIAVCWDSENSYGRIPFITYYSCKNGRITVDFNGRLLEAVKREGFVTVIDTKLLQESSRKISTINAGGYLTAQYYMRKNQHRGTLSIINILKYTNLPSFDKVQATDRNYKLRIVRPFIKIINDLLELGTLSEAKARVGAKGNAEIELSELSNLSIEEFKKAYIIYKCPEK